MRQRGPSPDGQGQQRELMATLLPAGEPVESLLRKAQFFTPGRPSQDYRELHRRGGRGAEEFYGSGGGTTRRCARPTG
jgi:nitrate reductase / nitrite oxidoreductase, alpha subunit